MNFHKQVTDSKYERVDGYIFEKNMAYSTINQLVKKKMKISVHNRTYMAR